MKKGYYSYLDYLEVSSKIKTLFPFAVSEVKSLGKGYLTGEIYTIQLALSGKKSGSTREI
jgi:hypothetical protein